MKKKRTVKTLIFLGLVALFLLYLMSIFRISDSNGCRSMFQTFYRTDRNAVDILHLGTSATSRYVLTPMIYEETGTTMYLMATDGQPFVLTKYLIKEALKKQDPKLIIIELRNVSVYSDEGFREGLGEDRIRRVVDNMRMSRNKLDAIDAALEDAEKCGYDIDFNRMDYIFSFVKYHSRWSQDMSISDFYPGRKNFTYQGTVIKKKNYEITAFDYPEFTSETGRLPEDREKVMADLLDYCDSLDPELGILFVASPYIISREDQLAINAAAAMAEARGYTVLNCNSREMFDEIGLDPQVDFYNSKHVNLAGAYKYTDFFAGYLEETYILPESEIIEDWEKSHDRFLRKTSEKYEVLLKRQAGIEEN